MLLYYLLPDSGFMCFLRDPSLLPGVALVCVFVGTVLLTVILIKWSIQFFLFFC